MKKLLLCLLILVMLFSAVLPAMAEETAAPEFTFEPEFIEIDAADVEGSEGEVEFVDAAALIEAIEADEHEPFSPDELDKAIFGSDDRITVSNPGKWPWSAICLMEVTAKCGHSWVGTGFMVGEDSMLSAAHCLVCPEDREWAKKITFYFGYKSKKNYLYKYTGKWNATVGTTFPNYRYEMNGDYACIHVDKKVGKKTGWFGMRTNTTSNLGSTTYYAAGYRDGKLRHDRGSLGLYGSNFYMHHIDHVPGNSGGPIFDKEHYAVGIIIAHDYEANYGYIINTTVRNTMKNLKH